MAVTTKKQAKKKSASARTEQAIETQGVYRGDDIERCIERDTKSNGLLYRTLKRMRWFDRKNVGVPLLMLFKIELITMDGEEPVWVAGAVPYCSVEADGKPSVDWTRFQPCYGK
jgi:hypothetical protein